MAVKYQRWIPVKYFKLFLIFLVINILAVSAGRNYKTIGMGIDPPSTYKPNSGGKANLPRRLIKLQGREVIPAMTNAIPGEPTCEELRAMWRYYKRQSRAELTNEIPQFGNDLFWDNFVPVSHQPMASFGPFRGRSKSRLRMKNPKQSLYGRVLLTPRERDRTGKIRRPMEEVIRTFGIAAGRGTNVNNPNLNLKQSSEVSPVPQQPIIHFSPPAQPTKETSFQKIKDIFREERIKEKGLSGIKEANTEFGKVVLAPPEGHDGRVANKPKELMTAFEKIRFGHADDILDEGNRPNLDVSKRRTVPLSRIPNQQQAGPVWKKNMYENKDVDMMADQGDSYNFGKFFSGEEGGATFGNENDGSDVYLPMNQNQMEMPTCGAVEGQSCAINADCFCVGFGLYRCSFGQCQVLNLFSGVKNEDNNGGDLPSASLWHSEPLRSSQLGEWEEASAMNFNGDL